MSFIGKARIGFPNYGFKLFRPRNQLKALIVHLSGALKEGPQWNLQAEKRKAEKQPRLLIWFLSPPWLASFKSIG